MKGIGSIARTTRRNLFGVGALSGEEQSLWDAKIAEFQARRVDLDAAETELINVRHLVTDPGDLSDWERAMNKIIAAKTAMDAIAGSVSNVSGWWTEFTDYVGLNGMRRGGVAGLASAMRSGPGGIGALPAFGIGLGTISVAISVAVTAISGAYAFSTYISKKHALLSQQYSQQFIMERTAQLVASGMDPAIAAAQAFTEASKDATRRANEEAGTQFGDRLEKIALYAAVAATLVFLTPKLLEVFMRGRKR